MGKYDYLYDLFVEEVKGALDKSCNCGSIDPGNIPTYDGKHTVTPSASADQTLYTAQKYVSSNIVVKKIPYSEVSNNSGGTTVTIGG